jgi:flagellin-like protein
MKAISPFVASVLLIAIVIASAAIISAWYTSLIRTQASTIGSQTQESVTCSYGGIRILTETIKCDFSGNGSSASPEYLNFSIENSGSINLYNFKVLVYIQGLVYQFDLIDALTNSSFTQSNPLRPDEVKTVKANITVNMPLADASWIEVITQCPGVNSGRINDIDCTP